MKKATVAIMMGCLALMSRPPSGRPDDSALVRGENMETTQHIALPAPRTTGGMALTESLTKRRSQRRFADASISLEAVSQLLWAVQGRKGNTGRRTAPSAGALYPLETYLVAGQVDTLPPGAYRYLPGSHHIRPILAGDLRAGLAGAALGQSAVKQASAVIVLTAVYPRTTRKYGDRGGRYVHMEAGHAAQNLCLQATALGLGAVPIGAFEDAAVARLLHLPDDEAPLYILPVGFSQ